MKAEVVQRSFKRIEELKKVVECLNISAKDVYINDDIVTVLEKSTS